MPIIHKIEHKDGQRTAVWEITEDEPALLKVASLNQSDIDNFSLLKNPGRRLEWLSVRALLREFYSSAPVISYSENGKPLLVGNTDNISISHSGKMVGIALHPTLNPGIDIELIHPRIFKIADRFVGNLEKEYIGTNPSAEQLTILWGAKEVMFKVCSYTGVSFKNELKVQPFTLSSSGSLEGHVYRDGSIKYIPMEYMKIGEYLLIQTDYNTTGFGKNNDI